jgi:predicted CoA-substrate-specific enzyme activase
MATGTRFTAGIDLGSVALKGILVDKTDTILRQLDEPVGSSLSAALESLLSRLLDGVDGEGTIGITGGGKHRFETFQQGYVENDLVATARAVGHLLPSARGIIEVGGHQSKWIELGGGGQLESFSLNDQCAAGSGAFLEQQAGRLKMDIETLSASALGASAAAPIAGRCAVFAKSDMIHLQQKGTPMDEITFGLCMALARNFRATLLRGTDLTLPVVLAGGGALNAGLQRAFKEVFDLQDDQLLAVETPRHLAALGVSLAARESGLLTTGARILEWLKEDGGRGQKQGLSLPPLRAVGEDSSLLEPEISPTAEVEAYLGVDVGSVSTDFCLMSKDGEVLDGLYLRTRGDPVGVIREGLATLRERTQGYLTVLGVGSTGSGRHLAGSLLGADVVKNEITCQLLGARHVLPEVDTILEIGGQDSKYVSVRRGRIADFVMNKICAAGTGSFLEEQGEALGVSILGEFESLALEATEPASLGSQCTVFMDSEVVGARQRGTVLSDILAGLALSVAKNYLERVVAGRLVGENVVFQGGVASNRAVVAAFEALLGKKVTVHPYNRLSGAIGAAVAARDEMGDRATLFRGLDAAETARVETFECRACSNLCQVSRIRVGEQTSFFGDVCERFTARESRQDSTKQPDLVREVEERLESYAGGKAWLGTAGIPRASMMYDLFPFWATFLRNLGFRVVLDGASDSATLDKGVQNLTAETCLPVKLIYGHVANLLDHHNDVDFVFLPAIQDIPDGGDETSYLCPFEESAGFMVGNFASDRVVAPAVHLASAPDRIVRQLKSSFQGWDLSEEQLSEALEEGTRAQSDYEEALLLRGHEVLSGDFEKAFVLLGKPYNITDPFENLNLSDHIRKLGLLAIPQQMLPFDHVNLEKMGLTLPWRYNRSQMQALMSMLDDDRLYPIIISNFGCGPDAFAFKYIEEMASDKPSLFVEFDEHRGEAGLITRLEAFIDEVTHHVQVARAERTFPAPAPTAGEQYKGRRIVLPYFADHAYAYQGALRSVGLDAIVLPPPDEDTIIAGEEVSSGKECHPYILLAGDVLKHLDLGTIGPGDVYFFPGTSTPCLMHEYASSIRLELERRGVTDVELLNPNAEGHGDVLGHAGLMRLGRGLLATELLTKLHCQMRPYTDHPQELDARFKRAYGLLSDFLAVDRPGDALAWFAKELKRFPLDMSKRRPLVGVAGDIYTRIHSFGNRNLFHRLEELGLEVWPAPFLTDSAGFGFRREMDWGMDEGRYKEAAGGAYLSMRKEWEALRVRYQLGMKVERGAEPGYKDVLAMAAPYVDRNANETVLLNVAKMVDYASRGAHGIINAISFHCMLGTVSASLTERIRKDHNNVPILTLVYTGKDSSEMETKLEAFAHQVKSYAKSHPQPESRSWFPSFKTGVAPE